MNKKRVLIVVHGHPDLNKGGGEIAAYNLYQALNERTDYEALFLGKGKTSAYHGGTPFSARAENEFLFYSEAFDFFKFSQHESNKHIFWLRFRELIEELKPTIVHFHHYLHLGLEALRVVKNVDPDIKIVLTLHEYLAICHNSGQMIKTNKKLCYSASPADCQLCFPDQTAQNFFLRELYIKSFFHLVDKFISPSEFLKERYVNWGIESEKIAVIENGQTPVEDNESPEAAKPNRFAYFGQFTQFKGLDVLLEAIDLLPKQVRKAIHLDVHGLGLEIQPKPFQKKVGRLLKKLSGSVTNHGAYEPYELGKLMQDVDWVVVPSSWWENSPLVIQEAFNHKKPVICSDIGGMAEKVQDGVDGLHFRASKATSLSGVIEKAANNSVLYAQLVANIRAPISHLKNAEEHHKLYSAI